MKLPLAAIALISLFGSSALVSADTTPPVVTAFSVSPSSVDITTGDATVQVTVHITDDDSGFSYANMSLYSPTDGYIKNYSFNDTDVELGGSDTDGTYLVDVVIPQYGAEGNWRLEIDLADKDNNQSEYGGGNGELLFPVPGNELIDVTNSGTIDTVAPQLASISISPTTVDVSSQDQTITVSLHITDDYSGLNYGYSSLEPPSGPDPNIFQYFDPSYAVGTPLDGTYTFDMTLPRGSAAGTWSIRNQISDLVGNFNFPESTFTVINNGNVATGGLPDACDATQYNWTTSGDEDWFFQTTTTHDGIDAARSGPIGDDGTSTMELEVEGPGTLSFWWKVDSESDYDELSVYATGSGDSDVISGDSGWIQVSLDIDSGLQTVTWTYSKDSSNSSGEDAGWVDQVYFAADSDNELPTLQYIGISPDPASVAGGQVDVTVTFEVSDDNLGVAGGGVDLYDSTGNNYTGSSWDSSNLVSGDEYSGTYQVTFTIDQSDLSPSGSYEPGTWRAEVYIEEDITFNSRNYGEFDDAFPNPGDELFTVTGGSSGQLGVSSINSFTPDPADITAASQTVVINFTLDDPFQELNYGFVNLRDSNNQYVNGFYFDPSSGSGNQFSINMNIPRYGPPGVWSVDFNLYDQLDNVTYVSGFIQNQGDNLLNVTNTGAVDTDPPVLTSISITPGVIDTSAASADVTITVALTDNLVGVDYAFVDFYDPTGSPVYSLRKFVDDNEIIGGSFTTVQTLPLGSTPGVWRCEMTTRDNLGNSRTYGTGTGTNDVPFPVPTDAEFTIGTVPPRTYEAFTDSYLLFGTDALPASNPDNDWANNALELILGLDPTIADTPDPAIYQTTRVGNELRLEFKLAPGLTATPSGNYLNITNAGSTPPFQVNGQTATDLAGPWTDTLPQPQGGGIYRVTLPIGPGDKGFCRLQFLDP